MRFTIEHNEIWESPFWGDLPETSVEAKQSRAKLPVKHENTNKYMTDNYEVCKAILKEILDFPDNEMTEDDVQKNFGSDNLGQIKEENVQQILTYYNGRLKLSKTVFAELEQAVKNFTSEKQVVLEYNLPAEICQFVVYPSEDDLPETMDLCSIRVIVSEDEKWTK